MNCAECRDNLVACIEGLLGHEESLQCQAHLETCAACRAEYAAIAHLQQQLVARGQAAAGLSIVEPVMRRVLQEQTKPERNTIMSLLLKHRWGLGLGTTAGAAAIILIVLLASPKTQATAAEIMTKGAQAVAKLTSIHLRGQLRTAPQDNFSYINPDLDFVTIELWKQFEPDLKWRVEKPKRVVVMDGQSTVMLIKTDDTGVKVPQRTSSAFDTDWLHRIANLSNTISNELNKAQAKGWKMDTTEETAANGRVKSIVTIHAKSGIPENDYVKNSFFENADTRRVYRFDAQTKLLEAVQVYLVRPSGEVLIFELSQIDYNPPIEPSVWQLELPADVNWAQLPENVPALPDNDKYASMTAEQAARAFLEACSRKDWDEAGKFMSPVTPGMKEYMGGLEIISVGESFTSKAYGGRFVPYEIKLRPQEFNVRVSNANAAKRCVVMGMYDSKLRLQQGFKWSTEPEVLTNNDAYARLSPSEAVQAYFDAQSKLDWGEMRKFTSESDVEQTKKQVEMAEKAGMDVHKQMPVVEVGEATWSPEQSAWFVKCRMSQNKKWNMAVRKDNSAGRWQVDGGI
jgi:outer membrane lipoprotein-sorting protein